MRHRDREEASRRPVTGLLLAVPLAAAGMALMIGNAHVRGLEAIVSGRVLQALTGTVSRAVPGNQLFMWDLGRPDSYGLLITAGCSSAFMVGPTMALAGLLAATRRFTIHRLLMGTGAVVVLLFLVNIVRLMTVALATMKWGPKTGYGWTHAVGGSMITIAGTLGALAVLLFTVFGGRAASPAER